MGTILNLSGNHHEKVWEDISFTRRRRRRVNELQVEYNLNNSEFVDKGHKNYFLYSILNRDLKT